MICSVVQLLINIATFCHNNAIVILTNDGNGFCGDARCSGGYPVMIQIDYRYLLSQNILYVNQSNIDLERLHFLPLLIIPLGL